MLIFCFGKTDVEMEDASDPAVFFKKMCQLLTNNDMISEEEEKGLLRESRNSNYERIRNLKKHFRW